MRALISHIGIHICSHLSRWQWQIHLIRENNSDENSMLMTEAYPLVMDAPLSAFDKTRIKTVCDALPKVAEQVIIFIKDTDGEIAEENMGSRN